MAGPKDRGKSSAIKRDRERAKKDAARERDYRRRLRKLEQTGLYGPKSRDITPYRKRRINALTREFGALLDADKTFFAKAPKAAIRGAIEAGLKVTRKGIFIEREHEKGHKLERFKLVRRKGRKRYDIIADRPLHKSKLGRERETYIIPLAGGDTLARTRRSLDEMVEGYGALGKGRRFRFTISDAQGSFMSRKAFTSLDKLWEYALQYRKTKGDQIAFLDKIEIVVVERGKGRKTFDSGHDLIIDELGGTSEFDPDMMDETDETSFDDDD